MRRITTAMVFGLIAGLSVGCGGEGPRRPPGGWEGSGSTDSGPGNLPDGGPAADLDGGADGGADGGSDGGPGEDAGVLYGKSRRLVQVDLLRGMPIQNDFMDPLFDVGSSDGWMATSIGEDEYLSRRRVEIPGSPVRGYSLIVDVLRRSGLNIITTLRGGRNPHRVRIWTGCRVWDPTDDVTVERISLIGSSPSGEVGSGVLSPTGKTHYDPETKTRWVEMAGETPAFGLFYMMITERKCSQVYLNGPVAESYQALSLPIPTLPPTEAEMRMIELWRSQRHYGKPVQTRPPFLNGPA